MEIYKNKNGYYYAEVFNGNLTRRIGCTFAYHDRELAIREGQALERLYKNAYCPSCNSTNVEKRHVGGSWTIPETFFWQCADCDHQWGHN